MGEYRDCLCGHPLDAHRALEDVCLALLPVDEYGSLIECGCEKYEERPVSEPTFVTLKVRYIHEHLIDVEVEGNEDPIDKWMRETDKVIPPASDVLLGDVEVWR